mgnify:CR=1 FL=1
MSQEDLNTLDDIFEELVIFQAIDGIRGDLNKKVRDHLTTINNSTYYDTPLLTTGYLFFKIRYHYLPDPFRANMIKLCREEILKL